MFQGAFLIALVSTAKKIILPGHIIYAAKVLAKCNKGVSHCHIFFLFWAQFLEAHRIQ
jgi:hypothetical protein